MIHININHDVIQIDGHADYADYGSDIVCASVSSIIYTTVNGIMNIDKDVISFMDEKRMEIKILKHTDVTDILLKNMIELLTDLSKQYPKNIKIDKGE